RTTVMESLLFSNTLTMSKLTVPCFFFDGEEVVVVVEVFELDWPRKEFEALRCGVSPERSGGGLAVSGGMGRPRNGELCTLLPLDKRRALVRSSMFSSRADLEK